jgi:S-disulfanyl-L-cysteine oxidoreductase SoxD
MRRASSMLLLCAAATAAIGATRPAPSTSAGLYTEEQAAAGAQLYAQRCVMCHGAMLEGTYETPGLKGKFVANWGRMPLGDLFDYLGRAMPQFAPGTLKPEEDAQLVAFLLKANGMPAGRTPLPADSTALRRITFVPTRTAN